MQTLCILGYEKIRFHVCKFSRTYLVAVGKMCVFTCLLSFNEKKEACILGFGKIGFMFAGFPPTKCFLVLASRRLRLALRASPFASLRTSRSRPLTPLSHSRLFSWHVRPSDRSWSRSFARPVLSASAGPLFCAFAHKHALQEPVWTSFERRSDPSHSQALGSRTL